MTHNLKRRLRHEEGSSLIEVLVAVMLSVIVIGGATFGILTLLQTNDKFATSTITQESLTNAVATIAHSLSASPQLQVAADYNLEFTYAGGDKVKYMYFDPAATSGQAGYYNLAGGFDGKPIRNIVTFASTEPPALIALTSIQSDASATMAVLVEGVSLNQHTSNLGPLFTYYNADNAKMSTPVAESERIRVKRIEVRIIANSVGRDQPLEILTSLAPNVGVISGMSNDPSMKAPLATVLTGVLPERSQDATLTWVPVAGGQTYTLFRDGVAIASRASSEQLKYVDTGRPWGSTQVYYVVVSGPGGTSPQSNSVSLTVVPQKPAFININPAAACAGNTVARDLTNCLAWTPRVGAVGYKLYKDGNQIYSGPATTFTDSTGNAYGDAHIYTVIAYNTGANGSGGNSFTSDPVTLMSPPKAPTPGIQDYASHPATRDGNNYVSWNNPGNALRYEYLRDGAGTATTALNYTDGAPGWGSTHTYSVRACNNAGCGPYSGNVVGRQPPAPFGLSTVSQHKRSGVYAQAEGSQDAYGAVTQSLTVSWGGSAGAANYKLIRSGAILYDGGGTSMASNSIDPGGTYQLYARATAGNGLTRDTGVYNFQASPAQMTAVATRPQTSNGYISRTAFWANAAPITGAYSGSQERRTVVDGPRDAAVIVWDNGWQGWNGGEVVSADWDKGSATSNRWIGGLQFQRTYVNVPGGYSTGAVSQDNFNAKGTGQGGDTAGNVSWTSYVTFRGYGSSRWYGSYNGTWVNVPGGNNNYPMAGGYDYEQINAY